MNSIVIGISPGELIDRISILQIKVEHVRDQKQRLRLQRELDELRAAEECSILASANLAALASELTSINQALWKAEDEVRECERRNDFGQDFIQSARSIYRNNDRRCALKRQINQVLGSAFLEQKVYCGGSSLPRHDIR